MNVDGDAYDHIGYIRAIQFEDEMAPVGVLARAEGDPSPVRSDPRKGTLHPLLAAVSTLADVDPITLWRWLPLFLAPTVVFAFYGFAATILSSFRYVAFALFLFVMFRGGIGREFFVNIAYGQHLSLVFMWVLVVLAFEYGWRRHGASLMLFLVLLAGGALIHVDVLVHVALAVAGTLFFYKPLELSLPRILRLAITAAVFGLLIAGWKMSVSFAGGNIIHSHPQGLLYFFSAGDAWFIPSPIDLLKRHGLLFLAGVVMVPALFLVRRQRRAAWMCLALSTLPIAIALNPFVVPALYDKVTYLVARMLLGIPAFVITSLLLGSLISWARRSVWWRKGVTLILLFVWVRLLLLSIGAWDIYMKRTIAERGRPELSVSAHALITYFRDRVPGGSVIMADPLTSYVLSAYTDGRFVAVLHQHADPNDSHVLERLRAVREVFSPYRPLIDAQRAVVAFDTDYVVFTRAAHRSRYLAATPREGMQRVGDKLTNMRPFLQSEFMDDGYQLFSVQPRDIEEWSWAPVAPFTLARPAALVDCNVPLGDEALAVVGFRVSPQPVVPGEIVEFTVAYRRSDDVAFGLPLRLHIRLEDTEYFDHTSRYPGDKFVRRYRERRRGTFVRFRIELTPFGGVFEPDTWPIGRDIYESARVRLPTDLRDGDYRIEITLERAPLIANFGVRDFLFNDDSYRGVSCGTLRVKRNPD